MKKYNVQTNIGTAKYVVNHYDGIKTHRDGSPAWDMKIFKNKAKMNVFLSSLRSAGYTEGK